MSSILRWVAAIVVSLVVYVGFASLLGRMLSHRWHPDGGGDEYKDRSDDA